MLCCEIISLFPEMFQAITEHGITGRAIDENLLALKFWNPRDFATNKHRTVDDRPYGGGPGMVMGVSPLREAIQAAKASTGQDARLIYVSPQGRKVQQSDLRDFASNAALIFVAGRYEGLDERLMTLEPGEEWSIGDYVLSGGELAIMVMIDAITRWLPGALGHSMSAKEDSFADNLLDCPHYTRPEVAEGLRVPEVLLSGDHESIRKWRLKQRLGRTWLRRPDLLNNLELDAESRLLLKMFIDERGEIS